MKKLFILLLLAPLLGITQTKTVLNSSRYFVKPDKSVAFEKALAAHAQKFHTGDWHWRVWSIETGPDAGGYMVTEGPSDWTSLDKRGDLGAAHMTDWNTNVAPLITERYENTYSEYLIELSTVQLTDYADKIMITHLITKPGKIVATRNLITRMLKVWKEGGESVAVYSLVASGDPSFIYVTRLKAGLAELATGFRKPLEERYKAAWGNDSFTQFLTDFEGAVERRWSELLVYKPELSSK